MPDRSTDRLATRAVHAGEPDPPMLGGAVPPIVRSTVNTVPEGAAYGDIRYPRLNTMENNVIAAAKVAALEGADAAVLAGSGMAAISTALLAVLSAGDHLLVQDVLYGGTHKLVHHVLPEWGITTSVIDGRRPDTWGAALRPNTRAIYVETLSNPLLQVPELAAVATFAQSHGLVSLIDNTFATPVLYRPATRGFDLVLHSATKYLNGHSDLVAGVVAGGAEAVARVNARLTLLGGTLDPQAAWLLHRGLKTLALRVRQQVATAEIVAHSLAEHPAVARVHWPGLSDHPDHDRASRHLDGFGAMLAVELRGGESAARRLLARARLFMDAPSLGGVESLMTRPATTSHAALSAEERAAIGVSDGLVRISIGIEDAADLVADLGQALA